MTRITVVVLCLLFIFSCNSFKNEQHFDPRQFVLPNLDIVLGFDLRNDNFPQAALVSNTHMQSKPSEKRFLLPFEVSNIINNPKVLSSSASYLTFSYFTFFYPSSQLGINEIRFIPKFSPIYNDGENISSKKSFLFLIRDGLERRFIFRYSKNSIKALGIDTITYFDDFSAIAVALPNGSKGLEISEGKTAIPSRFAQNEDVSFYPTNPIDSLRISYLIPATKEQLLISEYLIKLLGVLIVPLISIMFMPSNQVANRKLRKRFLILVGSIQIIIITIIIVIGLKNESSLQLKWWFDFGTILIGTIISAVVVYVKR